MRQARKEKIVHVIVNTIVAVAMWSFLFYELLEALCR